MRDSHQHLKVTPKDWEAFMDDLQQTLDKFKVPTAEQAELKAIIQSTYSDRCSHEWSHLTNRCS